MTGEDVDVALDGVGPDRGHARVLDETSFERLCAEPAGFTGGTGVTLDRLVLRPYAVARIDVDES